MTKHITHHNHLFLFLITVALCSSLQLVFAQESSMIQSPVIVVAPTSFHPTEDIFHVEGYAPYSGETVLVTIASKTGKEVKTFSTRASINKEFVVRENVLLPSDIYTIFAYQRNSLGEVSPRSEERVVEVVLPGILLGNSFIDFRLVSSALLFLVTVLFFYYALWASGLKRARYKKIKRGALADLHKEFVQLKKEFEERLHFITIASQERDLTEREEMVRQDMAEHLASIEKIISRDLQI